MLKTSISIKCGLCWAHQTWIPHIFLFILFFSWDIVHTKTTYDDTAWHTNMNILQNTIFTETKWSFSSVMRVSSFHVFTICKLMQFEILIFVFFCRNVSAVRCHFCILDNEIFDHFSHTFAGGPTSEWSSRLFTFCNSSVFRRSSPPLLSLSTTSYRKMQLYRIQLYTGKVPHSEMKKITYAY